MDKILDFNDANLMFEQKHNDNNEFYVYSEYHHENISYEFHIATRCITTTSTIRYLISSNMNWNQIETPTSQVYQVSIYGVMDDEDDDPIHCFIIFNDVKSNREVIFQSYYGKYRICKTIFNNLNELLKNYRLNWFELTGDIEPLDVPTKIRYFQPDDWSEMELSLIDTRYSLLK